MLFVDSVRRQLVYDPSRGQDVKIFMLGSSLASKSPVAKLQEQTKAIHRKTNKVTSIGSGKCFSTANAKKLTLGDHLSTIIPLG